jgi:hypothetical protein
MIMLKVSGVLKENGVIILEKGKIVSWKEFSDSSVPGIPPMTEIEITIAFKENEMLNGHNGIVWATYDFRQADIIRSTLLAQQIESEIKSINFLSNQLNVIRIINDKDIPEAMDFIWRGSGGLCLTPDWSYVEGEPNKSFEQWLGGQ